MDQLLILPTYRLHFVHSNAWAFTESGWLGSTCSRNKICASLHHSLFRLCCHLLLLLTHLLLVLLVIGRWLCAKIDTSATLSIDLLLLLLLLLETFLSLSGTHDSIGVVVGVVMLLWMRLACNRGGNECLLLRFRDRGPLRLRWGILVEHRVGSVVGAHI